MAYAPYYHGHLITPREEYWNPGPYPHCKKRRPSRRHSPNCACWQRYYRNTYPQYAVMPHGPHNPNPNQNYYYPNTPAYTYTPATYDGPFGPTPPIIRKVPSPGFNPFDPMSTTPFIPPTPQAQTPFQAAAYPSTHYNPQQACAPPAPPPPPSPWNTSDPWHKPPWLQEQERPKAPWWNPFNAPPAPPPPWAQPGGARGPADSHHHSTPAPAPAPEPTPHDPIDPRSIPPGTPIIPVPDQSAEPSPFIPPSVFNASTPATHPLHFPSIHKEFGYDRYGRSRITWDVAQSPKRARVRGHDFYQSWKTPEFKDIAVYPRPQNGKPLLITASSHPALQAFMTPERWGPITVKTENEVTVGDVMQAIHDYFNEPITAKDREILGNNETNELFMRASLKRRVKQCYMVEKLGLGSGYKRMDVLGGQRSFAGLVWGPKMADSVDMREMILCLSTETVPEFSG